MRLAETTLAVPYYHPPARAHELAARTA
jgi:hypothetical protein